jgi:5'-methylthioadenosine phosphorylase
MLGIIGGTLVFESALFKGTQQRIILTKYGKVIVNQAKDFVFIQRHQYSRPPHMINHRGNIHILKELGAKTIISLCSTGSLKKKIRPGEIVIPEDFMQFSGIPTFFDHELNFSTPSISDKARKLILDAAKKAKVKAMDGGTYVQTRGPRLETKAEIRMFSKFADIVGMTMASEATLAKEAGMEYACICSVDNYGNGLAGELDNKKIDEAKRKNVAKVERILGALLKR